MMSYQKLTFELKDNIGIINMMGSVDDIIEICRLHGELTDLCSEIAWDEEIRIVILTGISKEPFSQTTHLFKTISEDIAVLQLSHSLAELIAKIDKPVIAAINGQALGQGLELGLACDIRIASETSSFGLPQIKAGYIPYDGGTQRLSCLVGRGKALEMILTGEMIDAKEAYRIGLVNKVAPPDKIMTAAMDMAKEIASKGPIALRYVKESIHKGMDMTLEQALRLEADLYCLLHSTRDRIEGIKAFQEKRTPRFEGK
jgi:enoyl-CoA hydratase/carnithine racemase